MKDFMVCPLCRKRCRDGVYRIPGEHIGRCPDCLFSYIRSGEHIGKSINDGRRDVAQALVGSLPSTSEIAAKQMEDDIVDDPHVGIKSALSRAGSEIVDRKPIPLILYCPTCGARHIDAGEFATKAHHTHACQSCGLVWRPAIEATVGVQFLPGFKNKEKVDG